MKRPCLNKDYMVYVNTTQSKGPYADMKGEQHFEETGLINHTPVVVGLALLQESD
jgi:hypothetical protein